MKKLCIDPFSDRFNGTDYINELESMAAKPLLTREEIEDSKSYIAMQDTTQLHTGMCGLTHSAFILLAKIAVSAPQLTDVKLDNNNLGALGIEITRILMSSKSITKFDFSGNNLGEHAITMAADLSSYPLLKELDLWNNNLRDSIDPITRHLSNSSSLIRLNIGNNNLEEESVVAAANLTESMSLEEISMDNNNIGDENGVMVVAHLSQLASLRELSMIRNNLSESVADMGEILSVFPALTYLDLAKNDMGSEAGKAFAKNISQSPTLEKLSIWANGLREGCVEVIKNLQNSKTLQYVDMSDNGHLVFMNDIRKVLNSHTQKASEWEEWSKECLEAMKCLSNVLSVDMVYESPGLISEVFNDIEYLGDDGQLPVNPYNLIKFNLSD